MSRGDQSPSLNEWGSGQTQALAAQQDEKKTHTKHLNKINSEIRYKSKSKNINYTQNVV